MRIKKKRVVLFAAGLACCASLIVTANANSTHDAKSTKNKNTDYTAFIEKAQTESTQKITPYAQTIQTLSQHAYQNAQSLGVQGTLQQMPGFASFPTHTPQNPETATPGDVLIFVSFSMPDSSLRQWFAQAQRLHAPLIVRGLVNDSFPQTRAKIATLLTDPNSGLVVEPRLFTDYQITQVPAVVVRNTSVVCPATKDCPHAYPFDVIAGDVGLDDALSALANQPDGAATESARAALKASRS